MKSRFFATTNISSSPSPSQDGAEHLNLHGDSGSQLALWNAAFPLSDFEPKDLTIPPELEVPLAAIERPDQFPPFFLLGRRVDSSFRRTGKETVIEYEWARHSSTPVARVSLWGDRGAKVDQPWNGETPDFSFGSGKTLGTALQYSLFSRQAFRDMRVTTSEGVTPFHLDIRESYFADLLPRHFGVAYTLPAHGRTCVSEHPAGILRALALPCLAEDSTRLRQLLDEYLSRLDAYTLPWLPERLAHGSFSHRTAVLEWKPRGKKEQEKEFELKLFVGPWRAAVDLVEHLQEGGWDFRDRRRPSTVLCFPQELMWPLEYAIDGTEVRLPVLLPPQEALGVKHGLRPIPLGDVAFRRRGGDPKQLARLQAAVDALYPQAEAEAEKGAWRMFVNFNPERPIVGLCRTIPRQTPTVPVLFVLAKSNKDLTDGRNWPPFMDLARGNLPLIETEQHQTDIVFVLPNLPFLNHCHDEEGFFHLLPELVRYVEEEYGTAWMVAACGITASYRGRRIEPFMNLAGVRESGW